MIYGIFTYCTEQLCGCVHEAVLVYSFIYN